MKVEIWDQSTGRKWVEPVSKVEGTLRFLLGDEAANAHTAVALAVASVQSGTGRWVEVKRTDFKIRKAG